MLTRTIRRSEDIGSRKARDEHGFPERDTHGFPVRKERPKARQSGPEALSSSRDRARR